MAWVLSRKLLRHNVFSIPDTLTQAQQDAYLRLQVKKAFPFAEPGFNAVRKERQASIYAWDQSAVAAELRAQGLSLSTEIIPETLIRERAVDDLRIVAMLEGFEGQSWKGGFLTATRWWALRPSQIEWRQFARMTGANDLSDSGVPTSIELGLLERPWIEDAFSLGQVAALFQTARAAQVAITAVLCALVFILSQTGVILLQESRVKAEIVKLRAANKEFGQNRAAAYSNLDEITGLLALDSSPPQIDVLYAALAILGPAEARVLSWSFDRGNLDVIVRGKREFDPTTFITLFERDERFEGVSGTLVGQERDLQLKMTVEPQKTN